jgi:hypothetical protein
MVASKTYAPGEAPSALRNLVEKLLPPLLANSDPDSEVLRSQLRRAQVGRIELTGVGLSAHIQLPADVPRTATRSLTGGSAILQLAGLQRGAGCVLFVRDGLLSCLECFTYDEPWPDDLVLLSILNVVPLNAGTV